MKVTLIIPKALPGLNEIISADRTGFYKGANLKRKTMDYISILAKHQLRGIKFEKPVIMAYTWYEKNKRRDKDNISSAGRKVIQDCLVECGVLKGDGWGEIKGFSDNFFVCEKNARIEVMISDENERENNGNG